MMSRLLLYKLYSGCFVLAIILLASSAVYADNKNANTVGKIAVSSIVLPQDKDTYSQLVAAADKGDAGVDYAALRSEWFKSAAYQRSLHSPIEKFRKDLVQALKANDADKVKAAAINILSINYADMYAHKYMKEACLRLGDQPCADLHESIEMGMLPAVLAKGDGSSCAKAWSVVSDDEERFLMQSTGMVLSNKDVVRDGPRVCDRAEVTNMSGTKTIYFNVTGYKK